MLENKYQIYCCYGYGDNSYHVRASDMTLEDTMLFIKAIYENEYNEQELRIEIRRQLMEQGVD